MKKYTVILLVILGILFVSAGSVCSVLDYIDNKNKQEIKLRQKEQTEDILRHYAPVVKTKEDSFLYSLNNNEYKKVSKIAKDEVVELSDEKITHKTKYFYIPKLDSYIEYDKVEKADSISKNERYKRYLPFNENIITDEEVKLYRDEKLVYELYSSLDTSIIEKSDTGYYIEYNEELLYIDSSDVVKSYEKENSTEQEAKSVPVTVYHFIYLEGDNTCNEVICHHENQIKEQFGYLKDNNYFTLNTTELSKFIDGKIRLPEKSVLVTIDDGARAWNFVPLLEEYEINATLFLVSSWYKTEQYKSEYMEIASHTHALHIPGVCQGGQGSPMKCLDKTKLLEDLKVSRETLNGTKAFCFPFYEFNDYAINVLKEAGFEMAFIGGQRKATKGINKFKIPRITMHRNTTLKEYINYID